MFGVESRVFMQVGLAKDGTMKADVEKLLRTRQGTKGGKTACAVIREKLRIKPSILGPPDELNGLTDAELEKRLLAATDRKSSGLKRGLQSKLRVFETYVKCFMPDKAVELFKEPAGGWKAIAPLAFMAFVKHVGDGEVLKCGYFVDGFEPQV